MHKLPPHPQASLELHIASVDGDKDLRNHGGKTKDGSFEAVGLEVHFVPLIYPKPSNSR